MKRRLIFNTILNAISTGWGFLISLTLTPFLIRTLGKEAYGAWILVMSFSVVSGYLSLLDFGLSASTVKFVAEYHARRETDALNQTVSVGLYLFGALGMLGAIAVALFARLFLTRVFNIPPELTDVTRLLLYLLAIQILFEFPGLIFSGILEGLQRYDLLRAIEISRLGLYALILVVLLSRGYGLVALGITTLVIAAGRALVMAVLSWHLLPGLRLVRSLDLGTLRRIAAFSGQIFVIRINAVIYNQMDKAIIGVLLMSTLLTDYDIANKIQSLVLASLTFTSSLIVPAASQLDALEDRARLQALFLKGTKYTLAICLPVAVSAFALARPIIHVWIGPNFAHNAGITRLFVSHLFLVALTAVGYNIMIGMGRIRPLLWTQTITTAVNLIASVVITRRVGVAGVIWGTLIGTALALVPYLWHFLVSLDVSWTRFWREALLPTYPLAAVFAALLYVGDRLVMPDNLWTLAGLGLAGLAVYSLMFVALGLSGEERKMLLRTATLRAA
jgi:O-antigen/teichoic acid export membrane protein